ncbi:MAG: Fic family protein [Sulfuritalea sp.]|nr:Fic family protein [Sulfuritalea sp.]
MGSGSAFPRPRNDELRNCAVEIGSSVYLPMTLPQRIEELFGIALSMAAEIEDPFWQVSFILVHLPYLQPFEDLNKRVSRLAANIPLIKGNLSPLRTLAIVRGLAEIAAIRKFRIAASLGIPLISCRYRASTCGAAERTANVGSAEKRPGAGPALTTGASTADGAPPDRETSARPASR